MYTKKQIADALAKFIHNDIINDIDDRHLKFSLTMAKKALRENPDLLDNFLASPIVSSVVKEQDGMYDVDVFAKTLKSVLNEYESYPVIIPKIPVFAPKDSVLKITCADVDKIISYLATDPVSVA